MPRKSYVAPFFVTVAFALSVPGFAPAQTSSQSQPTEESKQLPTGSAAERKARMAVRAASQAYTKTFDLSVQSRVLLPTATTPEDVSSLTITSVSVVRDRLFFAFSRDGRI